MIYTWSLVLIVLTALVTYLASYFKRLRRNNHRLDRLMVKCQTSITTVRGVHLRRDDLQEIVDHSGNAYSEAKFDQISEYLDDREAELTESEEIALLAKTFEKDPNRPVDQSAWKAIIAPNFGV